MTVLVFAEAIKGNFKKTAYEAVCYGAKLAKGSGGECVVVTNAPVDAAGELGKYGASKVLAFNSESIHDSQALAGMLAETFNDVNAQALILADSSKGKAVAGRMGIKLNAGVVSSANALPEINGWVKVNKALFSGKAVGTYKINSDNIVISVSGNSVGVEEMGSVVQAEPLNSEMNGKVKLKEVKRVEGTVPLPEAERVVSAGRGMKGPENWGIIEELAEVLGATTACSRPVADTGWRPHHEHVGQTGIAIKPNLYIAIGISGAIQHLAGVNNSKTIVVINKDPEAPFFKAADYGVVGDLFDVVPRLTKALKEFKG